MSLPTDMSEAVLRRALEANGQRYTEQRAAVFRFLRATTSHPTADEIFLHVRSQVPGISLATVYKSLETLVTCGLAMKLSSGDGSARFDGRTEEHHHLRCVECGRIEDLEGRVDGGELARLEAAAGAFEVTGYTLELTGRCALCGRRSAHA
jgi:Fe2+ or Zn2+ uptake regulation protein